MGKIEEEPKMIGAPPWITTFVDMTSLLVTFFILLFTFSSIQEYDSFTFKQNFLGTRGARPMTGSDALEPPDNDMMSAMDVARGSKVPHTRDRNALFENLEEMGQSVGEDQIEFDPKDVRDGLVIRFRELACFGPGSAEVNPALRRRLKEVGSVLQHYDNQIVVEGHTDSEFKPTHRFPTAGALSAARASAAAEILTEVSDYPPELILIAGMGMEKPRTPGDSAHERTLNRRVEIQILSKDRSLSTVTKQRGF